MILKMIQNFENKMELQINWLETRIEKMQEMFNKDLEELKKERVNKFQSKIYHANYPAKQEHSTEH